MTRRRTIAIKYEELADPLVRNPYTGTYEVVPF